MGSPRKNGNVASIINAMIKEQKIETLKLKFLSSQI